jgi:hypothetical protein
MEPEHLNGVRFVLDSAPRRKRHGVELIVGAKSAVAGAASPDAQGQWL